MVELLNPALLEPSIKPWLMFNGRLMHMLDAHTFLDPTGPAVLSKLIKTLPDPTKQLKLYDDVLARVKCAPGAKPPLDPESRRVDVAALLKKCIHASHRPLEDTHPLKRGPAGHKPYVAWSAQSVVAPAVIPAFTLSNYAPPAAAEPVPEDKSAEAAEPTPETFDAHNMCSPSLISFNRAAAADADNVAEARLGGVSVV